MNIGLSWFDNSKDPIETKIKKAVEFYHNKYKKVANMVWINPSMPTPEPISGIQIKTSKSILPNHFWIGRE